MRSLLPKLSGAALLAAFFFSIVPSIAVSYSSQIPPEYGQVIYWSNEKSPNQLFVIGLSHRDTLTRLNGNRTSKVQAEVYQIGDWLIHHQGVELLLPEGFFASKTVKLEVNKIKAGLEKSKCIGLPEMRTIEERLADNQTYVNAEMLLNEYHQLKLKQVEDEKFYVAVRQRILKLVNTGSGSCDYLAVKSDLDYQQDRRTAALLQRIPGIVDEEFQKGNVKAKKAIFTIGMAHIHKIIEYLNERQIKISSPLPTSNKGEDDPAELNLLKENYGVCVIIPRTLANDQKCLEMNGLNKIISSFRKQSSDVFSKALP